MRKTTHGKSFFLIRKQIIVYDGGEEKYEELGQQTALGARKRTLAGGN